MVQMIEANWLIFIAALLIGIVVAYWIFAHGSKPAKRSHRPDVLDEGTAPAQRNQALIDSAPAASFDLPVPDVPAKEPVARAHIDPPAAAGTMAGIGEVIAVAAQEEADAADEDEEAAETPAGVDEEPKGTDTAAPVEPVAEPAPAPVPEPVAVSEPAPAPASATEGEADNLRKIKGLGPKMEKLLVSMGVTRYAQIAQWSEADLDDLDTKLGAFAGRPRRDKWVEQARLLSGGDTSAYEAEFGKL